MTSSDSAIAIAASSSIFSPASLSHQHEVPHPVSTVAKKGQEICVLHSSWGGCCSYYAAEASLVGRKAVAWREDSSIAV